MTQINGYLIVPVPEGAWRFYSNDGIVKGRLGMDVSERMPDGSLRMYGHGVDLPEGSWSIVEIDERVAGEIVDKPLAETEGWDELYLNYYNHSQNEWPYVFPTALESYSSLLRSKGYEKAILLKKK
jgi:hypothetical protein